MMAISQFVLGDIHVDALARPCVLSFMGQNVSIVLVLFKMNT